MSIDLAEQTALYRNPEAPIPARVADLLGRMNLDEKSRSCMPAG
ncbi:hypothetical protein [Burkholderia cepacia]|nr:hypothetical protein [Burkholderia cepacia]QOH36171.1 hypothetical protein C7S14_7501 [Burkholderia cepacia]